MPWDLNEVHYVCGLYRLPNEVYFGAIKINRCR